jgi:hypothetical protein
MLLLLLLVLVYLHLFGGGLGRDIIVRPVSLYLLIIDIGPRANTHVVVDESTHAVMVQNEYDYKGPNY